jgi:MSHA pilin protein MshC
MRDPFRAARGFTLTELVVVIIVATILAAFAAAKINTQNFDAQGFADQATAMIRYAQKIAIAQRRTVAVVVSASQIKLCYTDAVCSGGPVLDPISPTSSSQQFILNAKSGVSVTGPASFTFNALGQPSGAVTVTVTGDVSPRVIRVESETGYVH